MYIGRRLFIADRQRDGWTRITRSFQHLMAATPDGIYAALALLLVPVLQLLRYTVGNVSPCVAHEGHIAIMVRK